MVGFMTVCQYQAEVMDFLFFGGGLGGEVKQSSSTLPCTLLDNRVRPVKRISCLLM